MAIRDNFYNNNDGYGHVRYNYHRPYSPLAARFGIPGYRRSGYPSSYQQPSYGQPSTDTYTPSTRPPESPYDPWAQMDQIFSGAGLTRGEHGYDASGLLSTDRYEPFKDSTNIYDASHLLSPSY